MAPLPLRRLSSPFDGLLPLRRLNPAETLLAAMPEIGLAVGSALASSPREPLPTRTVTQAGLCPIHGFFRTVTAVEIVGASAGSRRSKKRRLKALAKASGGQ